MFSQTILLETRLSIGVYDRTRKFVRGRIQVRGEGSDKRTDKNYRNTSPRQLSPGRGMENLFHDGTSLTK